MISNIKEGFQEDVSPELGLGRRVGVQQVEEWTEGILGRRKAVYKVTEVKNKLVLSQQVLQCSWN